MGLRELAGWSRKLLVTVNGGGPEGGQWDQRAQFEPPGSFEREVKAIYLCGVPQGVMILEVKMIHQVCLQQQIVGVLVSQVVCEIFLVCQLILRKDERFADVLVCLEKFSEWILWSRESRRILESFSSIIHCIGGQFSREYYAGKNDYLSFFFEGLIS